MKDTYSSQRAREIEWWSFPGGDLSNPDTVNFLLCEITFPYNDLLEWHPEGWKDGRMEGRMDGTLKDKDILRMRPEAGESLSLGFSRQCVLSTADC